MGMSPGLLQFGEWRPDVSDINTTASGNILNVIPRGDGYGPFQDLVSFTQGLPGACRGLFFARNADGSITVFAGTATKLYKLNATDFSWTDVSLGAGSYAALPSNAQWQFVQFNTKVIAVQINVTPQVIDVTAPTAFANLAGAPPQASFIAVVNRFLVLGGISGFPYRLQWSGLNAITTWDNVSSQSNFQDLADGGRVTALAGGDQFGVTFQDSAVRSMIFAPGSPVVFDILRIASNDGILSPFAAVNAGDKIYFASPQGFKVIAPGGYPEAIGKEKVDRTFLTDVDTANFQLLIAATDPTTTRVYWAYKSLAGTAGQFDKIIVFDRVIGRWSVIKVNGEYLTALAKPGLTLESLDSIITPAISISGTGAGATYSGVPSIRLTISGLTAGTGPSNVNLNVANRVEPYGIVGTTEANGNWPFVIINSTHIDIVGPTFANAYVSGGAIGGSLDKLAFSLDTISSAALVQLAAASTSHAVGFFTGSNLEGQMETPEQDGNGQRFYISSVRPMTDCPGAALSIAYRDTPQGSSTYTTETTLNATGSCPVNNGGTGGGIDTRYPRVKLRTPYGATWSFAMGVEPEFSMTGWR